MSIEYMLLVKKSSDMNWEQILLAMQPAIEPSFGKVEHELVVQKSDGFVFYPAEGKSIQEHPDAVGNLWQTVRADDAVAIRRPTTGCRSFLDACRQGNSGLWKLELSIELGENGQPVENELWRAFQRAAGTLPHLEVLIDTSRPRPPRRRDLARR